MHSHKHRLAIHRQKECVKRPVGGDGRECMCIMHTKRRNTHKHEHTHVRRFGEDGSSVRQKERVRDCDLVGGDLRGLAVLEVLPPVEHPSRDLVLVGVLNLSLIHI